MTEADYTNKIRNYQDQLSGYQSDLISLQNQIDEAEAALDEANKYSDKFYNSVNKKKSKAMELIVGNGLNVLLGLHDQLTEKLTGSEFKDADNSVQEMISNIKNELRRLYSMHEQCQDRIKTTRANIRSTQYELDVFRREQAQAAAAAKTAESQNG